MCKKAAEWLLAGVIFARSTSLLFAKVGLESMSPLNLLAVRFCLAFAVLCVIFWKKLRHVTKTDLLHGMILGGAFFAVMVWPEPTPPPCHSWRIPPLSSCRCLRRCCTGRPRIAGRCCARR